jgi:hypothetical protein
MLRVFLFVIVISLVSACGNQSQARTEPAPTLPVSKVAPLWSDSDEDGIPDAAELHSYDDRANFRRWCASIAEMQFYRFSDSWSKEQRDCAGLVRFAWREALRQHDRIWFQGMGQGYEAVAPDVKAYSLEKSPLGVVGCTREDCAGFAADAYARCNGMGAVCVTYCVGGLSICNSIAGAYAEKSPVVVITGSPGLNERANNPLLHHKVRDFRTQLEVFEKLCVAATELSDPVVAFREIDRVLDAVARFKRPGYIEIPRDLVNVVPHVMHAFQQLEAVKPLICSPPPRSP